MTDLEYKTIAAPRRAGRVKGVKAPDERLAAAIGEIIEEQAAKGWRYLRADRFEVEEKHGFFAGWNKVERTIMVFARERKSAAQPAAPSAPSAAPQPAPAAAPAPGGLSAHEPAPEGSVELGGASRS